jgi:hypothetical protein
MSAVENIKETAPRRPFPAAPVVGLSVLGAVVGAVLALAFGGNARKTPARATTPAPAGTIAAGDLRLTLPEGWTATRKVADIPGFEGARKAFARSWNADVTIALLPAVRPSLLPGRLGAAKGPMSAQPHLVRAGALRAYRYVGTSTGDGVLEVVVVPTTQGVATIACASVEVTAGECDPALRSVHLARGSFLPLGADAAFLSRLPAVAAALDAERVRLRARLARASLPEGAARAAARLAGVYADADGALRPLAAPGSDAARTVRVLDRLRVRYGRLVHAVRAGDRAAFAATAQAIVRDEARLATRLAAWRRALAAPVAG